MNVPLGTDPDEDRDEILFSFASRLAKRGRLEDAVRVLDQMSDQPGDRAELFARIAARCFDHDRPCDAKTYLQKAAVMAEACDEPWQKAEGFLEIARAFRVGKRPDPEHAALSRAVRLAREGQASPSPQISHDSASVLADAAIELVAGGWKDEGKAAAWAIENWYLRLRTLVTIARRRSGADDRESLSVRRFLTLVTVLLSVVIFFVANSDRYSYRILSLFVDIKILSRNDELIVAIGVLEHGWHGSYLEEWRERLSFLGGYGAFLPEESNRKIVLWSFEGDEASCDRIVLEDRSIHRLVPVGEDLFLTVGSGLRWRWQDGKFVLPDASEENVPDGHRSSGELWPDPWSERSFNLSRVRSHHSKAGAYAVTIEAFNLFGLLFYRDDTAEIRVSKDGTPLCTTRNERPYWQRVSRSEYETIFGAKDRNRCQSH